MSLFANSRYRWRETYFVLCQDVSRPSIDAIRDALESLGTGYQVADVSLGETGRLEAMTVISHQDFAALDISYVYGEEVTEQVSEWLQEKKLSTLSRQAKDQMEQLARCDARFDIYHFQELLESDNSDDEDEYLDPGSLLSILQCLTRLCDGISIDPQSEGIL